jgi:hypothetical protein
MYTLIDVFNPISHCDATNLKAMLVNGKLMCGALTLSAITHPPAPLLLPHSSQCSTYDVTEVARKTGMLNALSVVVISNGIILLEVKPN